LGEELDVGRFAAAAAGPRELEQRPEQLGALDRVVLHPASVHLGDFQDELPVGTFPVDVGQLRFHVDRLVIRLLLVLVLGGAHLHTEGAAGAVFGRDLNPRFPIAEVLAAGVLALAPKDPASAEKFNEAEHLLTNIQANYTDTAWFAFNEVAFEAARTDVRAGVPEAEAQNLYAKATELLNQKELFDLRDVVKKLDSEYADSQAVTEVTRKPSFAEMKEAVYAASPLSSLAVEHSIVIANGRISRLVLMDSVWIANQLFAGSGTEIRSSTVLGRLQLCQHAAWCMSPWLRPVTHRIDEASIP
jgi:hypothetical protein